MKKNILVLLFLVLYSSYNTSFAQSGYMEVDYVKTPKGNKVTAKVLTGPDITTGTFAVESLLIHNTYNGAKMIAVPTKKYNCHGYAWHMRDGHSSEPVKIDFSTDGVAQYWGDGSYMEIDSADAIVETRVIYTGYYDHSAILDSINGANRIFRSKMGLEGALIEHTLSQIAGEYDWPHKYYVKRPNTTISSGGANYICINSTKTYKAVNGSWKSGVSWNTSGNLSIIGSNTIDSVKVTGISSGSGWVSINYCEKELERYNIMVGSGTPVISISGPTSVSVNSGNSYYASSNTYSGLPITGYEWAASPGSPSSKVYEYGSSANIYFYSENSYQVSARACNECGFGSWQFLYVNVNNRSLVYPNPVSDMLHIDVSPVVNANTRGTNLVFDIRLYNAMGSQLRQAGISSGALTQIDVSNLPNGNYYLHIYDGVSSTPDIHQIIVKH